MKKNISWLILIAVIVSIGLATFKRKHQTQELQQSTQSALQRVEQGLQQYKLHNLVYPTSDQGLAALVTAPQDARMWRGPYLDKAEILDAWGGQLRYETTEVYGFKLTSSGPDGRFETGDDVVVTNSP